MEIKEDNQRKLILSVLGVAILVVAVIGISFAIYQATFSQNDANSIQTGTITVSYTEPSNAISISDAMPMAEKTALKQDIINLNLLLLLVQAEALQYHMILVLRKLKKVIII